MLAGAEWNTVKTELLVVSKRGDCATFIIGLPQNVKSSENMIQFSLGFSV